jgi:hypothetical protein
MEDKYIDTCIAILHGGFKLLNVMYSGANTLILYFT